MATDETDGRIRNGRCIIKVVGECRDTVRIRIDGSRGVIASAAAQATVIFIVPWDNYRSVYRMRPVLSDAISHSYRSHIRLL